jgi:peptidoglycan hydrolase CwlO-like protein
VRGRTLAPVALAGLVVLVGQTAHAGSVGNRLDRARETQQRAQAAVRTLQSRVSVLQARLGRRQAALDRTASEVLGAQQDLRNTSLHLAVAEDTLSVRVRAAYEYGPASTLGVLLAAQTPADLASADEFARSVISSDQQAVGAVQNARNAVAERQQTLRARRAKLARQTREVAALLRIIRTKLSQARMTARRADLHVAALEREQAALEAAQRREEARRQRLQQQQSADGELVNGDGPGATDPNPTGPVPDPPGFDQSDLLKLLGPTGGRTCGTPSGLRDTGQRISGKATWYGPGFAGRRTASGAIFNPSLFTAAHRTLPFGAFLRVHHAGRCAIVLVNDRGPWIYDRIVDLSEAAGHYLGVSLTYVNADILVPA